jgi:hypothetical protein
VVYLALLARAASAEGAVPIQVPPLPPGETAKPPVQPITPYVDRGLLYGPAQGGITVGLSANTAPIDGSYADTSLDVALGLTPHLTLDGSLGTLSISPGGRYRGPRAGVWIGLVDTPPLELDAAAHIAFGVGDESVFHELEPGGVAVFRIADAVRIDVGAYLPMSPDWKSRRGTSGLGTPFVTGLRAPISVAVQITPYLHAAVSSGVTLPNLAEGRVIVPFGVSLGATLPLGGGGYAVVSPSVSWPTFSQGAPGPTVVGALLSIVTPP